MIQDHSDHAASREPIKPRQNKVDSSIGSFDAYIRTFVSLALQKYNELLVKSISNSIKVNTYNTKHCFSSCSLSSSVLREVLNRDAW